MPEIAGMSTSELERQLFETEHDAFLLHCSGRSIDADEAEAWADQLARELARRQGVRP